MAAQNTTAGSLLYAKHDTAHIGVMGHSQGAGGSIKAVIDSGGLISTAVTIEKPEYNECIPRSECPGTGKIPAGLSVFYINGSEDTGISPSTQNDPCFLLGGRQNNENSNACFYQDTPATVDKLWATLIGPNHNDVQGQPACAAASKPCTNGVYGYLGYPTAWMMDRLQNDGYAHGSFVSGSGLIFQETANL